MNTRIVARAGSFVLLGLLVAAAPASPQILKGKPELNVKLGLWETTTVAQMSGMPTIDTSKMTPEQKQRMEAAMEMAKQNASKPHTMKTCLTKEKLEKQLFQDDNASCKQTVITNTSSVYEVKFECGGARPSSGQWKFEALSPVSVKGSGTFTMEGGKAASTGTMTAKWISADCGDVK